MANPVNPCKSIITLENEKFRQRDDGSIVVATDNDDIIQAIQNSGGGSGGSSASVVQIELAGQTISAVKAVQLDGSSKLIDSTNDATLADASVLGVSRHAGVLDDSVEVVTFGPYSDSSITFAVNDCVYLGLNGQLTNVAPTTGILVQVGKVIKDNTIFVDIEPPIIL